MTTWRLNKDYNDKFGDQIKSVMPIWRSNKECNARLDVK